MKQWLEVGDPERRHKNEESRTSTRNEGPGTRILRLVNNNFESQNQEPKKEDKWITAESQESRIRSQESSFKDQEWNQIPRNLDSNLNPNNQDSRTKNQDEEPRSMSQKRKPK